METKKPYSEINCVKDIAGLKNSFVIDYKGNGRNREGVLMIMWNDPVNLDILSWFDNYIHASMKVENNDHVFFL